MDFKNAIKADYNLFSDGFPNLNDKLYPKHPVMIAQNEMKKRRDDIDFDVLKLAQGTHAPLRLMMERKMCKDVGRLPFLPSSNLMLDVLEGREDELDFCDFFRDPMEQEQFIAPATVMKRSGLM